MDSSDGQLDALIGTFGNEDDDDYDFAAALIYFLIQFFSNVPVVGGSPSDEAELGLVTGMNEDYGFPESNMTAPSCRLDPDRIGCVPDGSIEEFRGVYSICDGGYLRSPCLICPVNDVGDKNVQKMGGGNLTAARKYIMCTFGSLKQRFMWLKNWPRIKSIAIHQQ